MLLKSQLILMCFTSNVQAYVSTDAVGNSSTLRQPSGGGLVKIPYRIFVGGIAFNVSSWSYFLKPSQIFPADVTSGFCKMRRFPNESWLNRRAILAVTTVEVSLTYS